MFTDHPQKIIGNVALASLLAGAPVGAILSLISAILLSDEHSIFVLAKALASGFFFGAFCVFTAGLIVVAPALYVLRYFGVGGPFFVYAIAILFSLIVIDDNLRFGLAVLVFSLTASYVFCRNSYSPANREEL